MIDFSSMVDSSVEVFVSLRDVIYSRELSFWNGNILNLFLKDNTDKYKIANNIIKDVPDLCEYFDIKRTEEEWVKIFKAHTYLDVNNAISFFKRNIIEPSRVKGIMDEDKVMFMLLSKALFNRETLKAPNIFYITDGFDDLFIPYGVSKINKNNLITDKQFRERIKKFNSNTQASIVVGESILRQIVKDYEPVSLTVDIIAPSTDAERINHEFDVNIVSVQYTNTITNI